MAQILLLNGPNLNLLGQREPNVYGVVTLDDIATHLTNRARQAGHELVAFQSNSEGALIDRLHQAFAAGVAFVIFNPAGYTHTSVALRDALLAVRIPCVEVHLSNVHKREKFRHHSYFSDIAAGTITGFGALGYELALQAVIHALATDGPAPDSN